MFDGDIFVTSHNNPRDEYICFRKKYDASLLSLSYASIYFGNDYFNGGGSLKTSACNSEILQSEGLAAVSCPISRIIAPFLGHSNSHISNDAYKLKVEKLKTDVFGRPGGEC